MKEAAPCCSISNSIGVRSNIISRLACGVDLLMGAIAVVVCQSSLFMFLICLGVILFAQYMHTDSMLVAWHNLQPLEVIPHNFPARILVAMSKELTTGIMQEFPTVFRDKLGEFTHERSKNENCPCRKASSSPFSFCG